MKLCAVNKWIVACSIVCALLRSTVVYAESHHEQESTKAAESHTEEAAHTAEEEHAGETVHTSADAHKEAAADTTEKEREKTAASKESESHKKDHETETSETPTDIGLTVSSDKIVSIEYTLMLEDKSVQDSNVGKDPLNFVYGSNDIIPGLELALDGMKVGESKHVVVEPEHGYGPIDHEKYREISKDKLPPDALVVGTPLQGQNASGKVVQAWVAEIKEDTVILNFNHRLAGQTLYFDVKVVDIKEMEERAKADSSSE
ncbi:MAG: FKBP-type peptidyl-prolyl cis-trans isomerase [Candidatus Scalindua sp.]|nr:FKBP-type peptidyl-prolyl cis-trans isomerase [Candidatus Scalindua sp.]